MTRIIVLDGSAEQSLPILKALYNKGYRITIADSNKYALGFYSRFYHKKIMYIDPSKDPDGFLLDLINIVSSGEFDVLIPIYDVTAEIVSKNKAILERFVNIPLVEYPIFVQARDKSKTMKIANRLGIPIPKTYFPDEVSINEIANNVKYPVLIKPNLSCGAIGIMKVDNIIDLLNSYALVSKDYGPCTVQEFIPHTDFQYKAQIFLNDNYDLKSAVVYKKYRYYPASGGSAVLSSTVMRDDIVESCTHLLREMKWRYYADFDLIADPRDGKVKVMEINPRITLSVKICFEAGIDFASMLVESALGREVKSQFNYKKGIFLRNLDMDLRWFLESKERFHTRPSWFWFAGKNLRYQVMSLSDPGPTIGLLLTKIRRRIIKH